MCVCVYVFVHLCSDCIHPPKHEHGSLAARALVLQKMNEGLSNGSWCYSFLPSLRKSFVPVQSTCVHICCKASRLFAYHIIHVYEHHCYHITNICTSSNEPLKKEMQFQSGCLSTTKTIIIAFLTSDKKHTNRMLVKPLWLLFNFLRHDLFNNAER